MPSIIELSNPLPVYFIGHAGVGLLFNESSDNDTVRSNLRDIGREIQAIFPPPKALLLFSGHFEAGEIHGPGVIEDRLAWPKLNTVVCANINSKCQVKYSNPGLWHDFVNDFHDTKSFVYEYECPHYDAPDLAKEVWKHLVDKGIKAKRVQRGVDHRVWVPFKVMFPPGEELSIPIVQISTYHGCHLESQIRLGEAVEALRQREGYVIIGSGTAVHSFASIAEIYQAVTEEEKSETTAKVLRESRMFDTHLREDVLKSSSAERREALLKLESLPEFKRSHPTVEHFTPLLVAAGAAGDADVEPLGTDVVQPGMSYLSLRLR